MDRLASMAAFVKATEVGSFAAAAIALSLSPAMIAKHVTSLEGRIGARLINRNTRRQSLTEIGKTYYDRCKVVLAEAEWADSVSEETKGLPRGRLRINAPVSFGAHSLVPVLTHYLRQYTNVEIDLVLSDRFVDLIEDGFEMVFRIGALVDSALVARELLPFRLVACASPGYLHEWGSPHAPFDLKDHQCLGYASMHGPTLNDWRFVKDGKVHEISTRPKLQVNEATALLSAALDGFGIAFIAEDLASDGLRSGRLIRVLSDYETPARPMHLLFHPDRQQSPKLRAFIAIVLERFGLNGAGQT